jgi:hypothetical protein
MLFFLSGLWFESKRGHNHMVKDMPWAQFGECHAEKQ